MSTTVILANVAMNGNGSSRPPRGTGGYDRLRTLEMEDEPNPTSTRGGESYVVSEFRQFCYDFYRQMETACQMIDWDRIFMSVLATMAIILVMYAFVPYMQSQLIADQQLQHQFELTSLTISEFHAAPDQVTGKCQVTFDVSNHGDRSIYHETSVLSIFLDHELLWVARTGDFFIDVGNSITFNVSINKTTVSVPASFVPTAFKDSRSLHKPLRFKLKYDGMLREGLAAWYEERSHIYIVCGWIEMQFADETTLKGGPANCSVEI